METQLILTGLLRHINMTTLKHFLLSIISILCLVQSYAQCNVTSIIINTGYDPSTGQALAIGSASTPVQDPHWIVASATSSIPGAPAPGTPAYTIPPVGGSWVTNPASNPGRWINCINTNTYSTDGAGTLYNMTLGRPFRTCYDDSITFTLFIADDNFLSVLDVDGTALSFSQTTPFSSNYATYASLTQTVWLTAGTHQLNALVNNYNQPGTYFASNPTGLNIYGTISSASGAPSIVYEADTTCNSFSCSQPLCNDIVLQDSIKICADSTTRLSATVAAPDSIVKVRWSPGSGLSDTTILNPTLTAGTTSGYYHITVNSIIPGNLIPNPNFTYLNTPFSSSYTYVATATSPGKYGIGTSPTAFNGAWAAIGDHTTGSGPMMIVDGSPSSGVSFYCITVPVTPNSYYDFSAWAANLYISSPPNIVFSINGTNIGSTFTPTTVGRWLQFTNQWYSGAATTATICITDANTTGTGNDFAMDDITLQKVCIATDSIYVAVKPNPTVRLGNDTNICMGNTVTLQSSLIYSSAATYRWNTGSTTPSITANTTGTYTLRVNQDGCVAQDAINLQVKPNPIVSLGNDTGICSGVAIVANIRPRAGVSYLWSTGATTPTLSVAATGTYWVRIDSNGCRNSDTINVSVFPDFIVDLGPDASYCQADSVRLASSATYSPIAHYTWNTGDTTPSITIIASGTYWLQVTQGTCTHSDTITISHTPDYAVHLGPDTSYCRAGAVILQSSDTYASPTYQWSTGATDSAISVTASGTYWLQVNQYGCARRDSIHIDIIYDTLVIRNPDTAICRGAYVQALANSYAYGAVYTFQWLPTAGIAVSTSLNPIITPDTSAMYYLRASTPRCPSVIDSFYIDVQPVPTVFLGGNRAVCQFDTLHLKPSVSPQWYSGYTYLWAPAVSLDHNNTPTVVFTAGDSTKLYVTVTTSAGCTGIDSAVIVVHPGNFASIGPDVSLCPHDSAQIPVSAPANSTFHWSPTWYVADSASGSPWIHPIASVKYTVLVTSEYGCKDTARVNVTVYPAAILSVGVGATIYPGESYQLSALGNCSSFAWFPPQGLDNAAISNPVATPEISTQFFVTGTTENGCKATDSVTILVDPNSLLAVPNAFTPGTGENNILRIIRRGTASLNHFRIYNRWGNLLFESKDIDAGWDGNYKGKPQPFEVYVYDIEAVTTAGKLFSQHGNVTLIR